LDQEKNNYQYIQSNQEKKKKKEKQQYKFNDNTINPHNDRQRTIAQKEGRRNEREKRQEGNQVDSSVGLRISTKPHSFNRFVSSLFPIHAHVAAHIYLKSPSPVVSVSLPLADRDHRSVLDQREENEKGREMERGREEGKKGELMQTSWRQIEERQ